MIFLFRFSFTLDKSRELEIDIYWRDWRSLCAVKFLRLEEFVDDMSHGMALQLEPQGLLFAEVSNFFGIYHCAAVIFIIINYRFIRILLMNTYLIH